MNQNIEEPKADPGQVSSYDHDLVAFAKPKALSELVATAAAMTVAKDVLYSNAWWHGNQARAVAANSDTA